MDDIATGDRKREKIFWGTCTWVISRMHDLPGFEKVFGFITIEMFVCLHSFHCVLGKFPPRLHFDLKDTNFFLEKQNIPS